MSECIKYAKKAAERREEGCSGLGKLGMKSGGSEYQDDLSTNSEGDHNPSKRSRARADASNSSKSEKNIQENSMGPEGFRAVNRAKTRSFGCKDDRRTLYESLFDQKSAQKSSVRMSLKQRQKSLRDLEKEYMEISASINWFKWASELNGDNPYPKIYPKTSSKNEPKIGPEERDREERRRLRTQGFNQKLQKTLRTRANYIKSYKMKFKTKTNFLQKFLSKLIISFNQRVQDMVNSLLELKITIFNTLALIEKLDLDLKDSAEEAKKRQEKSQKLGYLKSLVAKLRPELDFFIKNLQKVESGLQFLCTHVIESELFLTLIAKSELFAREFVGSVPKFYAEMSKLAAEDLLSEVPESNPFLLETKFWGVIESLSEIVSKFLKIQLEKIFTKFSKILGKRFKTFVLNLKAFNRASREDQDHWRLEISHPLVELQSRDFSKLGSLQKILPAEYAEFIALKLRNHRPEGGFGSTIARSGSQISGFFGVGFEDLVHFLEVYPRFNFSVKESDLVECFFLGDASNTTSLTRDSKSILVLDIFGCFSVLERPERIDWTKKSLKEAQKILRELRRVKKVKEEFSDSPQFYFHCKDVSNISIEGAYAKISYWLQAGAMEDNVAKSLPFILSEGQKHKLISFVKKAV